VADWSGQSYRNISKAAQRWESADILTLDHGYARLKDPATWATALGLGHAPIVLLDWRRFFDACVRLLRSLRKAEAKSLPADGPVVASLIREAADAAAASIQVDPLTPSQTVQDLTRLLAHLR
jgi:hypothetical protein